MNESQLYLDARAALSSDDEREALENVLEWMNMQVSSKSDYPPRTAQNLRRECNLFGDSTPHQHSAYTGFLGRIARLDTASVDTMNSGYIDACTKFLMHGQEVTHELPTPIYRYVMKAVIEIWGGLTGMPAAWIDLLDTQPHLAFDQLVDHLEADKSLYKEITLGAPERPVWATFDDPVQPLASEVRGDATMMARHLGLGTDQTKEKRESLLVEVMYGKIKVENPRYPTVADAGWEQRFDPAAPENNHWGLTSASGRYSRQPEIVHDNSDLTHLERKPKFVGMVRPESD